METILSKKPFDAEGKDYDKVTGRELDKLYPLTIDKPKNPPKKNEPTTIYSTDEDGNQSFSAWVWHSEDTSWKKHSSTLDPRTGMLLKGKGSGESFRRGEEAEAKRGNEFVKGSGGRYFSRPKNRTVLNASEFLGKEYWGD
mgnify:CR=1 FL=1